MNDPSKTWQIADLFLTPLQTSEAPSFRRQVLSCKDGRRMISSITQV
jgi:hypothetical protein